MRTAKEIIPDTFEELRIIRQLVREGRRGWKINDISKSHGRIKVCDLKDITKKTDADLQVMAIQIYKRSQAYMAEYNAERRPHLLSEMAKPDADEVAAMFPEGAPETEAPSPIIQLPERKDIFAPADEYNWRLERIEKKIDFIISKIK